ncbi:DUF6985 domain-containing protein [Flaviaesturariibacter amylovorans]|uniref:DUF6985 domain-containing protein n=1 Tax=Flaviaesturariibacter amylovorans TaxID=1084520 RepID=A0ABP8HTM9_9BACT
MSNRNDGQIPHLRLVPTTYSIVTIYTLSATLELPVWAGFKSIRQEDKNRPEPAGRIELVIDPNRTEPDFSVMPVQAEAYTYAIEMQERVRDRILEGLLKEYPVWQRHADNAADDRGAKLPFLADANGFCHQLELAGLRILEAHKEGLAYTGYLFRCTWEPEHGLGILMHGDRVVKIGSADVASDNTLAELDRDALNDTSYPLEY